MQVKTQTDDLQNYLTDSSHMRGGYADKLFIPSSVEELSHVLKEANESRTPVTISGARTGTVGGAIPFGGCVISLERLNKDYPDLTSKYGFKCSYNPTFTSDGRKGAGWVSKGYYGLDQGPVVMMIENYRSDLIWRLMRQSPYIVKGLERAGFQGGWLET